MTIILVKFDYFFVAKRESEGWDSGYKNEEDFLTRNNITKLGKPSRNSCLSKGEQTIIIPDEETLEEKISTGYPWTSVAIKRDTFQFKNKYETVVISETKPGSATGGPNNVYLLNIPSMGHSERWVALKEESDYEWTIGTCNEHFVGPFEPDEKLKALLNMYLHRKRVFNEKGLVMYFPGMNDSLGKLFLKSNP